MAVETNYQNRHQVRQPEFSDVVQAVEEGARATLVDQPRVEPLLPNHEIDVRLLKRTRLRCYGFLNIFAKKIQRKNGVFVSKQSQILEKVDHNIGF
jgi:hypothetical protein